MTRTKLTSGSAVDDAASFQTATFAPSPNALLLLFVTSSQPPFFASGSPNVPDVSGNGLAWTSVDSLAFGDQDNRRLTCFRALGPAASAGKVTIDFGGQNQDFCAWSLVEYTDVDTGGVGRDAIAKSKSDKGTGASLSVSLATSADPNRNTRVGALALELNLEPDRAVEPGAGFTEIDEQNPDQFFGKGTTLQTQDAPATVAATAWTWAGAKNAAAIVVEVKAKPPATGPGTGTPPVVTVESLTRRFEPILFFHPDETFFPVDAKRFIEHAALWTAGTPHDDTTAWSGGPSNPRPVIDAGKVAAKDGEEGTYPFGTSLGFGNDDRFLELGGWKNEDGAHEAGVTPDSTNVYADRAEIAKLYRTTLAASRFWYHAELFDGSRLAGAARRSDLELSRILKRLSNPRLLCYYFFYPAHQQSVGAEVCQLVAATEVSSHAGDWQCVAILLEGDSSTSLEGLTPKYLGLSGSRPAAKGAEGREPHAFDDDGLTVLKVQPWRSVELTGEHPRFYVAHGSHGMYTTPGEHEVDPYEYASAPRGCGTLDAPGVDIPGESLGQGWIVAATFAKFAGSGAFPLGLLGGLAAIVVEAFNGGSFGVAAPDADRPDPDVTPPDPGRGKTLRPAGLAVPGAGADIADWQSQTGLSLGGRTYDFIVDREQQKWWPGEDGEQGFFGRWGQHVTADGLPRRAGPRFPDYARMFLTALADGDARGLLELGG